jgi:hypothetical protein
MEMTPRELALLFLAQTRELSAHHRRSILEVLVDPIDQQAIRG